MIILHIQRQEWETATTYWNDLSNVDGLKNDVNLNKIEFLSQNVFNKDKILDSKINVPSVTKMTELMNEIEKEIDSAKTTISGSFGGMMDFDVDDTKNSTKEMLNKKENKVLKQFVTKPV